MKNTTDEYQTTTGGKEDQSRSDQEKLEKILLQVDQRSLEGKRGQAVAQHIQEELGLELVNRDSYTTALDYLHTHHKRIAFLIVHPRIIYGNGIGLHGDKVVEAALKQGMEAENMFFYAFSQQDLTEMQGKFAVQGAVYKKGLVKPEAAITYAKSKLGILEMKEEQKLLLEKPKSLLARIFKRS